MATSKHLEPDYSCTQHELRVLGVFVVHGIEGERRFSLFFVFSGMYASTASILVLAILFLGAVSGGPRQFSLSLSSFLVCTVLVTWSLVFLFGGVYT